MPKKKNTGTRFRIFVLPRYAESELSAQPETITVSVPPNKIKPGPADDRMYVVDAINKLPYDDGEYPPYTGPANPPVKPGADGHFDKLPVNSRAFLCATMYATVRRTLDIWEAYFGRRVPWHFRVDFSRMELIPLVWWDNAHSGWGFLEFGFGRAKFGGPDRTKPYCENFDVLAHEMGHSLIFSEVGVPRSNATATVYYGGFHESSADLVALVASLHFNTIMDHLLDSSKGDLFTVNELSRLGELSKSTQIRLAFNYEKMSTVDDETHNLSLPLTGALFDIFVEVFQKELVQAGLITQDLASRSMGPEGGATDSEALRPEFEKAYKGRKAGFKQCLINARDYFGELLAQIWQNLEADYLDYSQVAKAALEADRKISNGQNVDTVRSCFRWRQISVLDGSPLLKRFTVEDCMPQRPVCGTSQRRSLRAGQWGLSAMAFADASAESIDDVLGRRVYNFCRSPDPDKSFISLDPTYGEFKELKLDEFSFHKVNFPTSDAFELAIDQFAAGLHDRLVKGFGYAAQPGAKGAVREVAREKTSTVVELLATVQSNYAL